MLNIIFLFLTLVGLGLLGYFQIVSQPLTQQEKTSLTAIFGVGWAFLSVSFIIWTVRIFKHFLLTK